MAGEAGLREGDTPPTDRRDFIVLTRRVEKQQGWYLTRKKRKIKEAQKAEAAKATGMPEPAQSGLVRRDH